MKLMNVLKNNGMLKKIVLFVLCLQASILFAQRIGDSKFSIVEGNQVVSVLIDKNDAKVVRIASNIFAEDVFKISEKKPAVISKLSKASSIIIAVIFVKNNIIYNLFSNVTFFF